MTRFDPLTRKTLQTIDMPTSLLTACAFGGPNLDQLYITTASKGLDAAALAKEPHAGSVFVTEVGVCGVPSVKFAG